MWAAAVASTSILSPSKDAGFAQGHILVPPHPSTMPLGKLGGHLRVLREL
jgi:hypothetical protein